MKILVPTDFSENANHAVAYAGAFADVVHANVTLLHVITPVISSPGIRGVMADEIIAKMNDSVDFLKNQVAKLSGKYKNAKFNYIIQESETQAAIIRKSAEEKCDLIVMGTHGATGVRKILFGSNTVSVMQHASVPVIAVPVEAKIGAPSKIVFATDYYFSDLDVIRELSAIAQSCNAEIFIVHIIIDSSIESDEKLLIMKFREIVSGVTKYSKFNYAVFRNEDLREGIENYTASVGADLLAVSTRSRGVFEKLFEKSIAESLVYQPHFPILVYHVDESAEGTEF